MKDKINGLATHSKNKNIRDFYGEIKEFKRGGQLRTNSVKDDNGNLLADFPNILNRWMNYLSRILKIYSVYDVRHMEMHTAEQLVPNPSPLITS
jgi:sulfatase maturation enzyme AslB (radical SAM superfamily)